MFEDIATVKSLGIEDLPIKFMGFTPKYYLIDEDSIAYVYNLWGDACYEIGYVEDSDQPTGVKIKITDPENFIGCRE